LYAASRLLRNNIGSSTVLDLVAAARKASDDALTVPVLTMAVQADEFRDLRARSIAAGSVPDVADAPHSVLTNILKGRMEDLEGWALFNQEKYSDAIPHLKQASDILPASTPSWRTAVWHLGAAYEQTGEKEKALDSYIKSYNGGDPDPIRRSVIEQLYRKMNGSLDGLDARMSGVPADATKSDPAKPETATDKPAETTTEPAKQKTEEPKPETDAPKTEPSPTPVETTQPVTDEALRSAASRLRSSIKITGRVLDANKTPLPNVTVVLISPSGSVLAATTDSEGNYSFTVAPSQKTYRIIPSKDGYSFAPLDRTFAALIDDQRDVDFIGKP
jgi:outer membrane biosynthesis protein TonB